MASPLSGSVVDALTDLIDVDEVTPTEGDTANTVVALLALRHVRPLLRKIRKNQESMLILFIKTASSITTHWASIKVF